MLAVPLYSWHPAATRSCGQPDTALVEPLGKRRIGFMCSVLCRCTPLEIRCDHACTIHNQVLHCRHAAKTSSTMEWGCTICPRRVHSNPSVRQQQLGTRNIAFKACRVEWGCTLTCPRLVPINPILCQQQLDNLTLAFLACHVEWGYTTICSCLVHINPSVCQQQLATSKRH